MQNRPQKGFTLVELLVVAVVLAIFLALVVPQVAGSDDDAKLGAAQAAVASIQKVVDVQFAKNGAYPPILDRSMFRGHKMPRNPYAAQQAGTPIISNGDGNKWHPQVKVVDGQNNHFYYNTANGVVRVRVKQQATSQQTLDLYNKANGTSVVNLSQTSR